MLPLRTRRRPRRWSRYGKVVLLVLLAVVVALLVGGVTQIGRQSGPYDASVNRSFAVQGAVVAQDSNITATSVRRLIGVMQTLDRRTLQAELDTFTAQAAAQAAQAEVLTTPSTPGGVQEQFAAVFADRAKAVNELRSAIDGLLGMHPLAVAGAPATAKTATATPTLLSSTQATNRIAAAGTLLASADRIYQAGRRTLARLPGHARLPASKWTAGANIWQIGAVAAQVDLVATSATLDVSHRLVLSVVQLTPPALPSPTGVVTPGTSVLSPTSTVSVRVILSDLGSVDEPHASVQFTLARQPAGAVVTHRRRVAVAAGGAVSLSPAVFAVKPGVNYQLTVAIVLPAGQADGTGSSLSQLLEIAPGT
jgi:hypothetical protein